MTALLFEPVEWRSQPYPHARYPRILPADVADRALRWLREEARWRLQVESFFEQHEISLSSGALGQDIDDLVEPALVAHIAGHLAERFDVPQGLELVDASAHRLTEGQSIRIHNDEIGEEETHRLLVQLNGGWDPAQGGLLLVFGDETPESLCEVVVPVHGSGFAFEISARSYHAVSPIVGGERYTVVYTFRRRAEDPA